MGVNWSWAFGAETLATLEDMGFAFPTGGGTQAPTSAVADIYTFVGFPGTKYSWSSAAFRTLKTPAAGWVSNGTVTVAIKANTSWYANAATPLIEVHTGSGRSISVRCSDVGTGTITLYMDGVAQATTTTLTVDDWHYLALKYDVSTVNWTAELWVNNPVSATITGSRTEAAETSGNYESGGFAASPNLALTAQFIVYDSSTPIASAKVPFFVTRIGPDSDESTTGTWAPSTGVTNIGVTAEDPFNKLTYTEESTPSSGDNVVTEISSLSGSLGVNPSSVLGATNHTYSTGVSVQSFASVRDSLATFVTGSTITPDASDTTYAFSTTTGSLSGASIIECKYKIV